MRTRVLWAAALCLAARAASAASIEGQVFHAATGAPLKKATVRLAGLNRPGGGGAGRAQGMLARPDIISKQVDDQGRFSFTGLDAGRYQLSAERQGFLRHAYGARKYNTNGLPIVLGQDQQLKDINISLTPQGVIAGKVLDEDGDPVANVPVRALRYTYRQGRKQWTQFSAGQTADNGEYRVASLEPGRYLVSASPRNAFGARLETPSAEPLPDQPETVYAATYYPGTLEQGSAVPVDVGAGTEVRGIDVHLRKTQVFRIRGKVNGVTGGRGLVMVSLTAKDGAGVSAGSAARAPDYQFELRGVPPGTYVLHARAGGGQQQAVAFREVQVGGHHVDGVVLSPAQGTDLSGSVRVEDNSTPFQVGSLSVALRPSGMFPGAGARARVGEDLKFFLRNVPPGRYTVAVNGLPSNCYLKSVKYGGVEAPQDGIEVVSGGIFEVTLSGTAGELSAAAVDKEGKPVPGATVALLPETGEAQANVASETGAVSFRGLKPGTYRLIAWEDIPSGAWQDPEFVRLYESRAVSVKIEPSGAPAVQVKAVPAEETDR